jgi:hypothetical protein
MPLRSRVNSTPRPSPSARTALAVFAICALAIGGCVTVRVTGADTTKDFATEETYKATYAAQMAGLHEVMQAFAPSSSNPGVCNKGGTKQGCYDADVELIQSLQAMLTAFAALPVPPRFVEADKLLRGAIAENIRGLELRNNAIAQQDNAAFTEHKVVLERALASYAKAYLTYPDDNRPQPPP